MMKKFFILIAIATTIVACSDEDIKRYPPPSTGGSGSEVGTAQIWVTSGDESRLLSAQDNLSIIDNNETSYPSITINEDEQMQEIEGFGAALTGSSAYLINNLSTSQKNSLLSNLFDPENGAGMSYLRLTIGASDFSLEDFTYNDMPQGQEDPNLDNFSIAPDEAHIIPVANDILAINPEVKFMGSPWSAPAWMKDNESLYGGKLEEQWYSTYANYFVKYIQAFENHGISIDAITPQNEPLHTAGYPTMRMEANEQANFIKNALGPAFAEENISTKIIAYDHNFDEANYPMTVLDDADANSYVSGSAFHAYAGEVSARKIYDGQLLILSGRKEAEEIKHMRDQEQHHLDKFDELLNEYNIRPSLLTPVWNLAGLTLGTVTALMGTKSAMACTIAVEEVIGEHYQKQAIKFWKTWHGPSPPKPLLNIVICSSFLC